MNLDAKIEIIEEKKEELKTLNKDMKKAQSNQIDINQIINASPTFESKAGPARFIIADLNIEDREVLAQVTDDIKNKWVQDWFTQGLTACETHLQKSAGQYCFGNTITAADCFLAPLVFTSNRFKVDLSKYKNINRVNENCLNRAEFQKAHPFRQPDTPAEFRI